MPVLTFAESAIRELHEDDTVLETRLVDKTAAATAARERIVADGRIDLHDLPDILTLLELVPAIHADADASRRYNLEINTRYCELAKDRRQWGRPQAADSLEEAA